jgi:hypothetical protein
MRTIIKFSFVLIVFFFHTRCTKTVGRPTPPVKEIDTTYGKLNFYFNEKLDTMFQLQAGRVNNKLFVNGIKYRYYEDHFNYSQILQIRCVTNKLNLRQNLYRWNWLTALISEDSIKNMAHLYTVIEDAEATCEFFNVLEADTINNYIIITKEIGNFREFWGEFKLHLTRTEQCGAKYNYYQVDDAIIRGNFHSKTKS